MRFHEILQEYKTRPRPHDWELPGDSRVHQPDYVLGHEIENTPVKGMKSLFITDVSDYDEIERLAKETGAQQLYFEFIWAIKKDSQNKKQVIRDFRKALRHFLERGWVCGLDTPSEYARYFVDFHRYPKLINNIALDLPNVPRFNKNTVFKIRDRKFGGDNGGVWTVPLRQIAQDKNITTWGEFDGDVEVIPDKNTGR
jgi:hypothetical protein